MKTLSVEKLSKDVNLSTFCCDLEDELGVNEFIHDEAWMFQENNFGVTYLFYYKDFIVGIVTLSMGNIDVKKHAPNKEEINEGITIRQYPSLLMGRIGVHNDCRKKGLGKIICDWSASIATKLQEKVGCRYISATTI